MKTIPLKPAIGQIVHYVKFDGRQLPAIITAVSDNLNVGLTVFDLMSVQQVASCPHNVSSAVCRTWHWPEEANSVT